jgi:hypothetical protein
LCVLFSVWMVVSKPAEHSTCRCVVSSLGFSSCDPVYSSRTELNEQWKHSNESSSFVPRMIMLVPHVVHYITWCRSVVYFAGGEIFLI